MKWSNVKWIYLREIRDQLRDRRTIFTIAVLPLVLYPLLGMAFLQVAQFSREHPTRVLVLGADGLPDSPKLIEENGQFSQALSGPNEARLLEVTVENQATPDVEQRSVAQELVESGEFAAVILIPSNFAEKLDEFRSELRRISDAKEHRSTAPPSVPQPQIFVSTANDRSVIARDRVGRVLERWRKLIVRENLISSQVPIEATEPFEFWSTDVAAQETRRAAVWSKILPFVVLIWALTGAFYPAIDLCAGEKERGTLETLLCGPAGRNEIVFGKLLTIMSFSMATSMLNLFSMGFTGLFIIGQLQQASGEPTGFALGGPPPASVGWLLLSLIPISALFSALSLAIAAFARSSKEGQYYLMPLLLITLPLMMLPMLPIAELDLGTSLIPITGMLLLLRALIEGQYAEALRFSLPVIGITTVCCLLAIRWAIDQFNNESVLFRESERWSLRSWLRHMMRNQQETPTISAAIFCGVILLVVRFFASSLVGMPTSWATFSTSTLVSLIAFIAAPALFMAVMLTRNPRQTLLLRVPRPAAVVMAILLAVAIHPLGMAMAEGVRTLYPFNYEIQQQLGTISKLIEDAPHIWAILAVLAVAPAICEELAFRGFILSGFRRLGHRWGAILASSIFFGAAHGILQQSISAFAVGVVIGYVAVQTGSLLPGIMFHFAYNSLSLVMALRAPALLDQHPAWGELYSVGSEGLTYQLPAVMISVLLTAAILSWFRTLPFEVSAEEALREALDHQSRQPCTKAEG
jgi:sodium transport system permease protein